MHRPGHHGSLAIAIALALLASGCPTWSPDDDTTTGADDDDDSADDDDDDSGDDDAAGDGWISTTGAPSCDPPRSVLWLDNHSHTTTLQGVHASTADVDCARYRQWGQATASAWASFETAYEAAWAGRDPVAGCVALRDYYQAIRDIEDQLWPPGSCSLQLRLDDYLPGEYAVDGGLGAGLSITLVYPQESYYGAAITSLGDCAQYSEWDGQWTGAQDDAADAATATRTLWTATAGGLTLALDGDAPRLSTGVAIAVEDASGTVGTLEFEIVAATCTL